MCHIVDTQLKHYTIKYFCIDKAAELAENYLSKYTSVDNAMYGINKISM